MKNLKTTLLKFAAVSMLLCASAAQASVTIHGVALPDTNTPINAAVGVIQQTIAPNGTTSGYGVITTINGQNENVFCQGCQLTFQFGGINLVAGTTDMFSGGFVNIYLAPRTVDINDIGNPLSFSMANTGLGELFLGLAVDGSFQGVTNGIGLASLLQLNATGNGLASEYFNTNGRPGGADLSLNISSTIQSAPGDPTVISLGSGNLFGAAGQAPNPVPEPASFALLGLGLIGIVANRKRKAKRA